MKHHGAQRPSRESVQLPPALARKWMGMFGGLGVIGLAGAAAGFFSEQTQFLHSYTAAYMFFLSLTLGGLFFTVLQHLAGAHWSVVVRRISETIMANAPWMALLLLPILPAVYGHHSGDGIHLYHWSDLAAVAADPILAAKSGYLNPTFFGIRLAIYFGLWVLMSRFFYQASVANDVGGDVTFVQKMRRWSAPSMLAYALTQTFASFDLLMSIEAHWFSTIFGVYFFSGSILAGFSLITFVALRLRANGLLSDVITLEHYHDLGKLMFGFTVFWTYIAFSQYFLIWYGNLPEETVYFLHRWEGSWKSVSMLLLFGHFVVPFVVLMSKHVKRAIPLMGVMTVWMLLMQFLDVYWMVLPNLHKTGFSFHWLDAACFVGLLGVWGLLLVRRLAAQSLVPVQDPLLERSMEFENA